MLRFRPESLRGLHSEIVAFRRSVDLSNSIAFASNDFLTSIDFGSNHFLVSDISSYFDILSRSTMIPSGNGRASAVVAISGMLCRSPFLVGYILLSRTTSFFRRVLFHESY
jgi:hypothetical protein